MHACAHVRLTEEQLSPGRRRRVTARAAARGRARQVPVPLAPHGRAALEHSWPRPPSQPLRACRGLSRAWRAALYLRHVFPLVLQAPQGKDSCS